MISLLLRLWAIRKLWGLIRGNRRDSRSGYYRP
jgi:hypothetical protein